MSSDDDFVAPPKLSKKPRPASPVVRAMAAGCGQSDSPAAVAPQSSPPAVASEDQPVQSPSQVIAAALLRHLVDGTCTLEHLQDMDPAAAAAHEVVADIDREVVHMVELRVRKYQLDVNVVQWRLQALEETVTGLQRAVLQLQEDRMR